MALTVKREDDELDSFAWDEAENTSFFEEKDADEILSAEEKEQLKTGKDETSTKENADGKDSSESKTSKKDTKTEKDTEESDSGEDTGGESKLEDEPFSDQTVETEDTDETSDKKFFKKLATELKNAGIFSNVEIKDDEEIDQQKFIDLQDAEVEARVDETFESFFSELDDDGKAFLKFKKEGGDTRKFFETLKRGAERPTGDLEDKKYQENIVRHYLSAYEGASRVDIDDRIEWLQSTGKLKKFAEEYDTKMSQLDKEKKEKLLKEEADRKQDREDERKEFIDNLIQTITKVEEVNGIPITKKDKTELLGYITKPAVKIAPNRFITQLQADLRGVMGKQETLVLLAKLLKNKFDLSDVQRKVETKQVAKLREKLDDTKTNIKPSSSGSSKGRSLSEFFN
jgi:hypothetical protein